MIRKTLTRFHQLRAPVRALVWLMWLHEFGLGILFLFYPIFLFQVFGDIEVVIFAFLIRFTAALIVFVGLGVLWSKKRWNVKYLFWLGNGIFASGFLLLQENPDLIRALSFSATMGAGIGLFWCAMHSFELGQLADKERDFYSSMVRSGGELVGILGSLLATISFLLTDQLALGTYTLLFMYLPLVPLISFFFLKDVADYYPEPIRWRDAQHFFNMKKHGSGLLFLVITPYVVLFQTLLPLMAIIILQTELNVGIFDTVLKILAIFAVVWLGHVQHADTRTRTLGVVTPIWLILLGLLAWKLNLVTFLIFSLGTILIKPIVTVALHTISLSVMTGLGHPIGGFYPSMVMREIILWVGRMILGGLLLLLVFLIKDPEAVLRIFTVIIASVLVLKWLAARHFMKHHHNPSI